MIKYLKSTKLLFLIALILGVGVFVYLSREKDPYLHMPPPELPEPSLGELADEKNLELGNFASLKYLRERPYKELISNEFSLVIADGEPNWKFEDHTLRPSEKEYNFDDLDKVMVFAEDNNLPVRIQHLLWGDEKWLPDWLKGGEHSDEQLHEIITEHIETVMNRYKGQVGQYTVVNEAFSRRLQKGGNKDWWGMQLGESYLDTAFLAAQKTDPDAKLILNDFGNERINDVSNLMYDYIKNAKQRGIKIDGLGMQMHINGLDAPTKEEVVENMRRFEELGIQIYITEFDVSMHGFSGSEEERNNAQAKIYADMVGACLEVGHKLCPSFSFLGLVDRQSWYKGIGITDGYPLLFTDDYKPKPAYYALRNVLR